MPITGKSNSLLNTNPPVKVPSPPITINPSMLLFFNVSKAFFLPSLDLKSLDLAVFKIVPPLFIIPLTLLAFISTILSEINPSYPLETPTGTIL